MLCPKDSKNGEHLVAIITFYLKGLLFYFLCFILSSGLDRNVLLRIEAVDFWSFLWFVYFYGRVVVYLTCKRGVVNLTLPSVLFAMCSFFFFSPLRSKRVLVVVVYYIYWYLPYKKLKMRNLKTIMYNSFKTGGKEPYARINKLSYEKLHS